MAKFNIRLRNTEAFEMSVEVFQVVRFNDECLPTEVIPAGQSSAAIGIAEDPDTGQHVMYWISHAQGYQDKSLAAVPIVVANGGIYDVIAGPPVRTRKP